MARRPAAAVDEEAELQALSEQAERTRRALAETADALTRTISRTGRHLRWMALAAAPAVIALTAATVYLIRRRSA